MKFDINNYCKKGYLPVIELEYGDEYLIPRSSIEVFNNDDYIFIKLKRIVDQEDFAIEKTKIIESILENGVIDYLDEK